MRFPSDVSWSALYDAGFQHVICLASSPAYNPSPLTFHHMELEDLIGGKQPSRFDERDRVFQAAKLVVDALHSGEGVVVHCDGGWGRTGTVLGTVLVMMGHEPGSVIAYLDTIHRLRGKDGWPESPWQKEVILAAAAAIGTVPEAPSQSNAETDSGPNLDPIPARIRTCIQEAGGLYQRLILLVGQTNTGKTKALQDVARMMDLPYINLNLELSRRLLDYTAKARPLRVSGLLDEILAAAGSSTVLLDNIEILFDPALKQDPLRRLQYAARQRIIVAAWNGHVHDGSLTYAEPGHPEHRRYTDLHGTVIVEAVINPRSGS
jgi:hypothetical protein